MLPNEISKMYWNQNDFESLDWHDCKVYSIAFGKNEHEVAFDIDFIIKWVDPKEGEENYSFWIAPATLVFKNVYNFNLDISNVDVVFAEINRENPSTPKNAAHIEEQTEYDWEIQTTSGSITFKSVGFEQHLRKEPILTDKQFLSTPERT